MFQADTRSVKIASQAAHQNTAQSCKRATTKPQKLCKTVQLCSPDGQSWHHAVAAVSPLHRVLYRPRRSRRYSQIPVTMRRQAAREVSYNNQSEVECAQTRPAGRNRTQSKRKEPITGSTVIRDWRQLHQTCSSPQTLVFSSKSALYSYHSSRTPSAMNTNRIR